MKRILSLALLLSAAFAAQSYAAFSQYNEYEMKEYIDGIVEFLSNNPFKLSAPDLIRFQELKKEWQESKEGKNQTAPVSMWPHMRDLWPSFQLEHYKFAKENEENEYNMSSRITELVREMRKMPQILDKMDLLHRNFFYGIQRSWQSRCAYRDSGTLTVIYREYNQADVITAGKPVETITLEELRIRNENDKVHAQCISPKLYSPCESELYPSLKEMYKRYFTVEAYIEANYTAISQRLNCAASQLRANLHQMSQQLQEQWCALNMQLTAAVISPSENNYEHAQFLETLTLNLEDLLKQHQANRTQQINMES